ncbi:MAG: hypothetical protein F4X87_03510 [Chloroflexi bacterium]|nr:hypothetical protein [Chloroflexota bacterium]
MRAFPMPIRSMLASRLGWLLIVLLSLLALPFSAQAQIEETTRPVFTAVTANSLTMTWTAVAGATGYEYARQLPDRDDSGQTDASTTSVTITGLDSGKRYGYNVRTIVNGQKSNGSNVAVQWTSPIAPRNLRAICVAGTVVQLVWSDSPGAGSYEVKIGSGSWQSRSGSRSRIFSQLALNTAYTFYVRALISADPNFSLLEALSAESSVAVTTQAAHVDPPTNLQTSEITSSGIKLTWEASPTSGVTSYEVSANGGAWVDSGSDLEHSFTGLDPDTSYRLRARAKTSAANSCSARATAVSTLPDPPAAPTSASIDYLDSAQTAIILTWTKAEGATDYQVNGGALTEWTSVGDVATYTFAGLTADTEYTVQLRASNSGGTSAAVQATGRTLPNAPAAPADLAVSARTQTSITVTWTKSAGADSYEAYGGTKKLPTVNDIGDVATYTFSGLTADTQYTLQVRALNDGGYSSNAQVVSRTLPNPPAAPTALKTSGITQTGVTLTWTKSTGATGYKVRKDSGDSWTELGDVATYSFTGLTGGTSYDLELRASNAGGDSAVEDITVLTLPAPPTGLTTSGITESGITLGWTKSTGATGYKVQADAGTVVTLGDVATYSFASLSAGTSYTLKVIATNASGDSTAATITAVTLPAAPTALKTSGITHNSVTLTWSKSTGATGYKVQANAGAVTTLGDVATYSFSSLASGTSHTLKVSATNASGDSTAATIAALTLPAAPTGLTTSGITKTGITLNWTKSTGATGYKVRKDSGDSWTVLGDVATYGFTGLTADTEYDLEVLASNAGGDSAAASVTVSTLPNAPAAPTALKTSGITQTSVTLTWAKSAGATAYKVRAGTTGDFTALGDVATYTFTGLTANTAYTLQVRASNAGGDSSIAQTTATTNNVPPPPAPAAPTSLATSGITQTGITLSWTKSTGATGYKVRKDSGDSWTVLGDVATYAFTGLTADTEYDLEVLASNAGGDSAAESVSATTLPDAPAAPTQLATSGITQTGITLTWSKSTGATAYKVRAGTTGDFTTLGNVATYTFTGLTANTAYTLQVRASNAGGDSSIAQTTATTNNVPPPPAPAAPTSLSTSGITQSGITLTWTKSTGATGYKVRKDSGDSWTVLGDVATYSFTGLTADTEYDLEVLASNAGGDSAAASVSATTLPNAPAAPTSLKTSGITKTGITLTWTKSAGATGYKARKDSGDSWTVLGDVATYAFTGLTVDTEYDLEVLASNAGAIPRRRRSLSAPCPMPRPRRRTWSPAASRRPASR